MRHASKRAYDSYVKGWKKAKNKYGTMQEPLLDYKEYRDVYEGYYLDRLEEGKDTKNINRLILADQSFLYTRSEARARQTFLREFGGRKGLQKDIRTGKTDITKEEWQAYKEIYHKKKEWFMEQYGDDFDTDELYKWLGQNFWGSN